MDEEASRLAHALTELAGLILSAWAVDYATGGQVRESIIPYLRRAWVRMLPALRLISMAVDSYFGRAGATIAEAEDIRNGR